MIEIKPDCFRAICDLQVSPNQKSVNLHAIMVGLEVGALYETSSYYDEEGMPNEEGIKFMTNAFVHGLLTNIKIAEEKGYWKEADHMRFIIDQLNQGFTDTSDFKITKYGN